MLKLNTIFYSMLMIFGCYSKIVYAEDASISKIFNQQNINGTIVLKSLKNQQVIIHNDLRAKQRFPIASTFKIYNSLIALEEKVVQDKNSVFKWNGTKYSFPTWNQDQTLETAYKVSCVWCYQQIAEKIGNEKYQHYLSLANYGQLKKPFQINSFWLDGSLQVSALEQIEFLKKIYNRSLPFSQKSYETLKEISLAEKTTTYAIYAKTGWAKNNNPQIGWYVGYVETKNDVWFFALNINIENDNQLNLRQQLTKLILQEKQLIK